MKNNFKNFFTNSQFYTKSKFRYSSKKHNTNFDYHLDWFINSLFTKNLTMTNILLAMNAGIFAYSWLNPTEEGRYVAQSNVSYSHNNLINRDYINLFASILGSRKPEDFIFDSAVLVGLGKFMERTYGSPFIFKVFIFSFYLGIMNSIFWVNSTYAKNSRYILNDPKKRLEQQAESQTMKFSSMHGFTMSLVYFYLFKNMKIALLPVFIADYLVWGPYYSTGLLNGVAWGLIV